MEKNKSLPLQIIAIGFLSIVLLLGIVVYQKLTLEDGKLHVVFCDVGQGDAIFIKTPANSELLIDGGPDGAVLDCLSKHMPFWDRTLEAVFLTHPDADHYGGLIDVIERYTILQFFETSVNVEKESKGMDSLSSNLARQEVSRKKLALGDTLSFSNGLSLQTLWPDGLIKIQTNPNDASLVLLLSYQDFTVLLTGDAESNMPYFLAAQASNVDILKVPHHGSTGSLSDEFLKAVNPTLAIISVGENNRFGHPTDETIKLLRDRAIKLLRTDQHGEIEIISDGEKWTVKTKN